MTYAVGSIIQAADYNGFAGDTPASAAYASDSAAQNKVAALVGVGYGNRGYGQSSTLAPVSIGNTVTAVQWNTLQTDMGVINTHTGSTLTLQPTVSAGDTILAQDGSGGRVNIGALVSTLDNNRNLASISQMAVTNVLSSVRTASWGGSTLIHSFTVDFGTEDAARYFFNAGSQIRFSASRTGGSGSAIDNSWTNLLNNVGTVQFGYNYTAYTGSGGYATSNLGYYGLTASYQQIFAHYGDGSGSGYYYYGYGSTSYTIFARRESYAGLNGANGSLLRFSVQFDDTSAYAYYSGQVTGTLTSTIDMYKSAGVVSIASPTFTNVNVLSQW